MAKKAKKLARREWTKDDVKELKAHSKARTPVVKIAKMSKCLSEEFLNHMNHL